MSKGKIAKKNQEFIEQDNEKDAQIEAMRKATAASRASVDEGEQVSSMPPGKLDGMSFEDKLKAVKEEGAAKRQQRAEAEAPRKLMDEMLSGKAPVMRSSIYDDAPAKPGGITFAQAGGKTPDDELNVFVKIGAGLLSLGLLVVFIPSDFVFSTNVSSAPSTNGELSPEVVEQVKKQVTAYEEALASTPEDVDKLRGAAESYVVLEDYTAAIPLLKRLLEIQPSVENVETRGRTPPTGHSRKPPRCIATPSTRSGRGRA